MVSHRRRLTMNSGHWARLPYLPVFSSGLIHTPLLSGPRCLMMFRLSCISCSSRCFDEAALS